MRHRLIVAPLAVVILAAGLGAGWAASKGAEQRVPLAAALDAMPVTTSTVDFTDWSGIEGSLDEVALDGLTIRSVLAPLDAQMRDLLGWSVRDLAWEAYGRTDGGAITALGLGDVTVERAERSFAALGSAVDGASHEYRLAGDSAGSAEFASTFAWVGVVADRDLVLAAPDRDSLDAAMTAASEGGRSLLGVRAVAELAAPLRGATSVLLQDRQFLCLSSVIDPADEAAGRQLAVALGASRLADPTWGARAVVDGAPQRIVFAVALRSDAVARDQAGVRTALASGPFIGRSGQVNDSLRDLRSTVSGTVVSLDFALTPEGELFMTDTGPVVFAGCAPRPSR